MEATNVTGNASRSKATKKKLTLEENRVKNLAKKVGNRTAEAFLKMQGSFIVYDPNFM